jgi:hypothetical protein
LLKNGNVYATQGGGNVTITTSGADVFVNNAKIVKPNLVIPNGVAHVVDQVCDGFFFGVLGLPGWSEGCVIGRGRDAKRRS